LAPEGKVRVWLKNDGRPNLEEKKTQIITVSVSELNMCKGVMKSDFSYEYDDDIIDFIKNKNILMGHGKSSYFKCDRG
jgi:Protein of unknown function (DUF2931).